MKIILSLLVSLSLNSVAHAKEGYTVETTKEQSSVYVVNTNCEIEVGLPNLPADEKATTVLRNANFFTDFDDKLEFEYDIFSKRGCDFQAMDEIVLNAKQLRFGFALAEITLEQRKRNKISKNHKGECTQIYEEQITIKFSEDFILKSNNNIKFIAAEGCD